MDLPYFIIFSKDGDNSEARLLVGAAGVRLRRDRHHPQRILLTL